jgi:ribosomal protein L6P/L9E
MDRRLLGPTSSNLYAPFVKSFIIRGIGYQADIIENNSKDNKNEFFYERYLSLRVGHSFNLYKPVPNDVGVAVKHKNRKVVVYGYDKNKVSVFSNEIYQSRPPSVYTGRGIRKKGFSHIRKVGKKDGKKGKL